MTPALLDPLRFPLRGSSLIEASAGTGKTFTIAALYLRLVLGHGGDAAFATPLTPPEILVVTFTEAATKELRDRIRARLAEAAGCFRAEHADVEGGAAFRFHTRIELRLECPRHVAIGRGEPAAQPAGKQGVRTGAETFFRLVVPVWDGHDIDAHGWRSHRR